MASFNAGSIEATLDVDRDPFQRGLALAREQGKKFGETRFTAKLGVDRTGVTSGIQTARTQIRDFTRQAYKARLTLDTSQVGRDLVKVQGQLAEINGKRFTAHVDVTGVGGALAQVTELRAALREIDGRRYRARFDLDGAAAAIAQLAALRRAIAAIDGQRASANVSTSSSGPNFGASTAGASAFTSAVGGAAGGMQLLIALGIALAPVLVAAFAGAAAAAGGLVAILGVVGVGLAALGAGVIGNVMGVLGAQKDLTAATQAVETAGQAAAAAQQGVAAAARGVQQAEQGLAQARQAAAAAVANAERALTQAHRGAQAAQEALNQARKDAADRLADYRDQLRGAALDEEAAELAVRRARVALANTLADPEATKLDRDEAQLALQQALFQLSEVRESRDELQEQAKKDRKAGVEGSDEVKAAKERLAAANAAVADAERALADARQQGAQQIAAAQQAVADANRAAGDAARTSAEAQAALAEAQTKQAAISAKLSTPAARGFMDAIDGMKDAWSGFLAATNGSTLDLAASALDLLAAALPKLAPLVNAVAPAVQDLFERMTRWVESPGFDGFIAFVAEHAPGMISSLGDIVGNLATMFGGIAEAFTPFAEDMLDGLADITQGWSDWAGALTESKAFDQFLDFVRDTGPGVLELLGNIGRFFRDIGEAIAPMSKPVLDALNAMFNGISDLDPTTLAILLGIGGVILGLTVAPVAGTALAVLGLASAFKGLSDDAGPVGDIVRTITDLFAPLKREAELLAPIIRDELVEAWGLLKPELQEFADYLEEDFKPKWEDFWDAVGPVIRWLAQRGAPALAGAFTVMLNGAQRAMRMLGGLLDFVTGIFTGDFRKAIAGLRDFVVGAITFIPRLIFDTLSQIVKMVTGSTIGEHFRNLFGGIRDVARNARDFILDRLVRGPDSLRGRMTSGFDTMMDALGRTWDRLQEIASAPVKFVVDYVYNRGIVPVINAIPGVDNINKVDTSDWGSHATGGVLPGYSPGTDDHTFYSPTGGKIKLSGGEGILVPEAVRAIGGKQALDAINGAARGQAFAAGGIVQPVVGGYVNRTAYNLGHDGMDINHPDDASGRVPYFSATSGTVTTTGYSRGYGNAVFVASPYGELVYGHSYDNTIQVKPGDPVRPGTYLANIGNTGRSQGAHLHFGFPGGTFYQAEALLNGAPNPLGAAGGTLSGMASPADALKAKFAGAVKAVKQLVTDAPGWMDKLKGGGWPGMMTNMLKSAGNGGMRDWVNDKIPGPGPMPKVFDTGGWLMPGQTAINLGDTPEPVLTDDQWRSLRDVALEGRGGLSSTDVDRIVRAIEDNRGITVPVSSDEDVEKAFTALGRELRKRGR